MIIIPPQNKTPVSGLGVVIALVPLYLLKYLIINPFLVFTSLFPLVIISENFGITNIYTSILLFLSKTFIDKTLEEAEIGDIVFLFFTCTLILTMVTVLLQEVLKKYMGWNFQINIKHLMVAMSALYIFTWAISYLNSDPPEPIFLLLFYLFNMYSLFSSHIIRIAIQRLLPVHSPN